ncbi:fused DSP-PTPase phosphatase/NAD kinase-like protein [Thioalkalivibrio denitrificans]|uniref:fused DSP-PTPase phosphatase/NAD kinase-like protein n=1 Tax=Thioalkalivibrio denitrificans TaxID=108003 RepID=UPI001FE7BB9B|nr:sulfur transferase domain-containing protein [Thioalkalivibrio denitrificans]
MASWWPRWLDGQRGEMRTPWERFIARVELLLVDHGFIRAVYSNRHRVSPNLYRSAQPSPAQVARMARRGVRTIINLRGARGNGTYLLEQEACQRHGVRLVDFPVGSRSAPSREKLLAAQRLFREIEYPALVHCKSGADRAGFMAALYLALHEGRPVSEAIGQLGFRYGHLPWGGPGILDHFFRRYEQDSRKEPVDFARWVTEVYDRDALKREYRAGRLGTLVVDRLLRRE